VSLTGGISGGDPKTELTFQILVELLNGLNQIARHLIYPKKLENSFALMVGIVLSGVIKMTVAKMTLKIFLVLHKNSLNHSIKRLQKMKPVKRKICDCINHFE
jgi:hypothetical protein